MKARRKPRIDRSGIKWTFIPYIYNLQPNIDLYILLRLYLLRSFLFTLAFILNLFMYEVLKIKFRKRI